MDVVQVVLVLVVALAASGLTLVSGFGLGTLLLPAFALVFPIHVAVAATAVVHLANNVWKGGLLWHDADWRVVGRFGVPAALAAFLGAAVLLNLEAAPVLTYRALGGEHAVTPVGLVVGGLILVFSLFELVPRLKAWNVSDRYVPLGGVVSGFFGGLSGHQGALRSVFLTKVGLDARGFVATSAMAAIVVDVARLIVYGAAAWRTSVVAIGEAGGWPLIGGAVLMAFLGAVVGKRFVGKITLEGVRVVVGALLVLTGLLVASGLV